MTEQKELTVEDYLGMLRRRWVLIVALAVVGGACGYGATHFIPKQFTSQTLVLVQQPTVPGDYVKPVVNGDTSQRLASMQQEILSRTRLEPVIQQFDVFHDQNGRMSMGDMVDNLRSAIKVTPIQAMAETRSQGLPGFYVSVTFGDPHMAQQICATITSMFMEENLKLRSQQAEQTTKFLGSQLGDAKAKLDDQDAKLADFKRRYLGSLPDEEQANLNLLTGLTSQLDATTQTLSRAQQDRTFTESMLSQQVATWEANQQTAVTGELSADSLDRQLTALQEQLSQLQARYTDSYPDVVKVKKDIASLQQRIADSKVDDANAGTKATDDQKAAVPVKSTSEPTSIQALRGQIHQYDQVIKEMTARQARIQQQIDLYQTRVQSSPAIEQEYKELTRDYQTALDFYNDLLRKRDQSAMATDLEQSQQGEQFQVLDPANLPDRPSFPNKMIFGAGGLGGGLALGVALSFLLEMQDTSLRSEKDVERLLHLPVLAMVPTMDPLMSSKAAHDGSIQLTIHV